MNNSFDQIKSIRDACRMQDKDFDDNNQICSIESSQDRTPPECPERKKLKTQRFKIKKKAIIERRTSYAEVMKTWRSHKIPAG
jgi:hypothetical protein